jgi:hypothetical protein
LPCSWNDPIWVDAWNYNLIAAADKPALRSGCTFKNGRSRRHVNSDRLIGSVTPCWI